MEVWEWQIAAAIIALPFLVFGMFELMAYLRRRRARSIAQRPKGRQPRRG